jgi:Mg2+-importing ATPase
MAFGNTMKYVFMATSANFGNMFSMAGASLFLDFLPLLPKQILLMNLLTDIPEMTIAGDRLDEEVAASPQRWDMKFIRRFMLVFGPISSAFDFLTFAVLLLFFRADQTHFRTAWFTESVVSAALVVLVVRTRRSVLSSRPGRWLAAATLALIAVTVTLPWWPIAPALGFAPLPPRYLAAVLGIALLYGMTCEVAKYWFYHRGNGSVPKTPREHLWRPKQARR